MADNEDKDVKESKGDGLRGLKQQQKYMSLVQLKRVR